MYKNEKNKQYHADYRERNRDLIKKKTKKYHKDNPWMNSFNNAKQRCNNPNNPNYPDYGQRGILFLLTKEDIKFLWFRYKADNMDFPTIDRKDNNGNYELSNCQFLENNINSQKDRIIPKLYQYSKDGKFIKQWKSQGEASRQLHIQQSDISKNIHNVIPSSGGFIWKQEKS